MDKDQLESKFRGMGTVPIFRDKLGDHELYVAEGLSHPPHLTAQQYGIQPEDFPLGMYFVWWFAGRDERLFAGGTCFYDALSTSSASRLADVKRVASDFMNRFKKNQRARGVTN